MLIDAAMDLSIDGLQTFRLVILPNIATALLAAMLAFALSFDEVVHHDLTAGSRVHPADLMLWRN